VGGLWTLKWAFEVCGRFMGAKVGVANFFLQSGRGKLFFGESIGTVEKNTLQLKFLF